jgi:hypothetical protein
MGAFEIAIVMGFMSIPFLLVEAELVILLSIVLHQVRIAICISFPLTLVLVHSALIGLAMFACPGIFAPDDVWFGSFLFSGGPVGMAGYAIANLLDPWLRKRSGILLVD